MAKEQDYWSCKKMTLQETVLPPIPKLRVDIIFDNENVAKEFEKYFKTKKEVRSVEFKKSREYRHQLTVIMEKEFAESKVIPAITKLMNHKSFILFCITNIQKTMML